MNNIKNIFENLNDSMSASISNEECSFTETQDFNKVCIIL